MDLNPKIVHYSAVSGAELDALGRLSRQALVAHVGSAIQNWGGRCGSGTTIEDVSIEHLEPVLGAQTLRIDFWVERLDENSCTYGFLCSSESGAVAYARGELSLIKRDRQPWSAQFRDSNAALMKDLPAYA
jgi:acyl-CoA thioesterase FadM